MSDEAAERTNTTPDQRPKMEGGITGKGFTKGDPRINRKGRPKSFDQLRALAQKISHEPIADSSTMTVAEAILRTMAKENPARFVEIAFGKVPDEVKQSGTVDHRVVTLKAEQLSDDDLAALIASLTAGSRNRTTDAPPSAE
jgi:hypothetical protein